MISWIGIKTKELTTEIKRGRIDKPMENNFIIITEESDPNEIKLMIAMKFGDGYITDFINLKDTAFPTHPKFKFYYHGFVDYSDAAAQKLKIQHFLCNYLNKN